MPRLRLRERIHLGIALHVAVNLGFALAVTLTTVPVAEASALRSRPTRARRSSSIVRSGSAPLVSVDRAGCHDRDDGLDRFDRLAL